MYKLRQTLRYRLANLILEAVKSGQQCDIEMLNKYEAIIFRELKEYLDT